MECEHCRAPIIFKKVMSGVNKGRESSKCCKWYWNDSIKYDSDKFKNGACYSCGYWGCFADDCERVFDWYGNRIPAIHMQID